MVPYFPDVLFNKYKAFSVLKYSLYINTSGNWENEKLCGNTTPEVRSVFTTISSFPNFLDCERSLLSAGLGFRARERKGGTADNTSRNETALPTQRKIPIGRNRYACQSDLICSNYAINNFQSEC